MRNNLFSRLISFVFFSYLLVGFVSCSSDSKITPDSKKPSEDTTTPTDFKRDVSYLNYVEYRNGNLPLVISVPHDGGESNAAYTLRTKQNCLDPNFATVRDANTADLANLIDSVLHARTGKYAYLVRCGIKRTYIDMNRDKTYAVPLGSKQGAVYDLYHNKIKNARSLVTVLNGKGLLVDIHGHGHAVKQVELGYLVSTVNLNKSDAELLAGNFHERCSIYSLTRTNKGDVNFVALLRGVNSLGSLLAKRDVPSVPCAEKPMPKDEPYLSGGYITKIHGSAKSMGGTVDAIQMEFDSVARNAENRRKTAEGVADALLEFLSLHY